MTTKDLYRYAKEHGIEGYNIQIQFRDGGGLYDGHEDLAEEDIIFNEEDETITL